MAADNDATSSAPKNPAPGSENRLGELLALGESSLRKLAASARQLQDALGHSKAAAAEAGRGNSAQEALSRLKNGIYQMRNLFAEARKSGGVPEEHLNKVQKCLKSTAGPLKETLGNVMDRGEAYVKEQPVKGLLACLGLGLLLGVLIGR